MGTFLSRLSPSIAIPTSPHSSFALLPFHSLTASSIDGWTPKISWKIFASNFGVGI
jgi:hypothetical protein